MRPAEFNQYEHHRLRRALVFPSACAARPLRPKGKLFTANFPRLDVGKLKKVLRHGIPLEGFTHETNPNDL